jgi:acetyl esterase
MLTTDEVRFYAELRLQNSNGIADVTSAPLLDSCFAGLPDTLIITAQCDPLSDDGRHYRDAIITAGGRAVWINEAGLVHGYLRARTTASRARASFARITDTLSSMGKAMWTGRACT